MNKIKTAQERLLELTPDTHNAPVSALLACQNAEIRELREALEALEAMTKERDALKALHHDCASQLRLALDERNEYQVAADKLAAENKVLRDALANLLEDTQHAEHEDCEDGPCPVREARAALKGETK